MDGDVDVSQRKGKVITIYDIKLVLEYSGMERLSEFHLLVSLKSFYSWHALRGCDD